MKHFLTCILWAVLPSVAAAQSVLDPRDILRDHVADWLSVEEAASVAGYGAEANPTGDPIAGGEGYRRIHASGDYTARTYDELRSALQQARSGEVVFVPGNVEVDFSGQESVVISSGVTLASDRGHQGSAGALLFSDELDSPYIVKMYGDYGRVTGLRIRGPFPDTARVPIASRGVDIEGYGCEVDNNEISAFSHHAIAAGNRSYIHHNYIHHNQRNGLGYGVSGGSQHVIEANHFDYNRHDIAGSGSPGTAYVARYNLVGSHAIGHHFDMHGGRDRGDGTSIAGDWLHIHHNTFLGSGYRAVGIRGVPSQGAWIHNNWFVEPHNGAEILVDGNAHVFDNVVGRDRTPHDVEVEDRSSLNF